MDSSESPPHGDRRGSACNGYFGYTCYHSLFVFNHDGDLERAMRRRGNHNSAKFWRRVLLPEKRIKIGAKVVRQAKYVTFRLAEVAVLRELFVAILERIERFGVPPQLGQRG